MQNWPDTFFKATDATVFESRLILAHVDEDEDVSLSLAGKGSTVLDDLGVQGSVLEFSDPDKPAIPPEMLTGLPEFDEMPSQSDFEDLVERANASVVEARESRAAALGDEKDSAPSASLKRALYRLVDSCPQISSWCQEA